MFEYRPVIYPLSSLSGIRAAPTVRPVLGRSFKKGVADQGRPLLSRMAA